MFGKKILTGASKLAGAMAIFTDAKNQLEDAINTVSDEQDKATQEFEKAKAMFETKEEKYLEDNVSRNTTISKSHELLGKINEFLGE